MFFEFNPNEDTDGVYSEQSSEPPAQNSQTGRTSTLDAELNIESLSALDRDLYEFAEQAIESVKGYPATSDRLKAIVQDFRERTTLRTMQKEKDFLDSQMNVQAQSKNNMAEFYKFPDPVIELGEKMMSVMNNIGYDRSVSYNFVESLYRRLHEVFVQEVNMYSSGETLKVSQIIKDFLLYKKSNKNSERILSKVSSILQKKGYKKPFKIIKIK